MIRPIKIGLIGLLLLLYSNFGLSRDLSFTTQADRFFTDSVYRVIIIDQCYRLRNNQSLSRIDCESNFDEIKTELLEAATPLIVRKFSETEKKFSRVLPKDRIVVQLYENALRNAITVTLKQQKELTESLFRKNNNDRILSFHSDITLQKSGELDVTETIRIVNCNSQEAGINNSIKRGITRDFPTRYETHEGFMSSVPFELLSLTRNGKTEPHHTESLTNGIRIFCGRKDYLLDEGIHEYVIRYRTAKQMRFHRDRDEFYWNVNGNGWQFSIDRVSADIHFPEGANLTDLNCYTGLQGSKEKNCHFKKIDGNSLTYFSDQRLMPNEGLTISAAVQKGIFENHETAFSQFLSFAKDNILLLIIFPLVFLLVLILFIYWWRVGRDPKQGVIYPSFEPPGKLSPATCGYLFFEQYQDRLLSAALIDLAVQKKIRIQVDKEGMIFKSNVYTFLPPERPAGSDDFYQADTQTPYGFSADELYQIKIEKGKYNENFASIRNEFKKFVEQQIVGKTPEQGTLLKLNNNYIGIGFVLLFFATIGSFIYCVITRPTTMTMIYAGTALFIGFLVQAFFTRIIKALTIEGRRLADEVAGFRMYLNTAERNELDLMNPPEENIQLFERYLPFAVALGVENRWSERFKTVIDRALENGYQPSYYSLSSHSGISTSANSFTSSFASGLSGSVAAASSPPSSSGSSGGGGGGFSGGGGGGGGGGGW